MRRNIIVITTVLSLIGATARAEQPKQPKMQPDQIMVSTQEAASSDGGLYIGLAFVLAIAIGLMLRDGPTGYVIPDCPTC